MEKVTVLESLYEFRTRQEPPEGTALVFEDGEVVAGKEGAIKAEQRGREKSCAIGYALAASSCEGVSSVDACTVTALDAITAFCGPKPQLLLAE